MLSSTSNSETASKQARCLAALLFCLLALALAIEAGTRVEFIRLSRIQRRIHSEYVAAREIRPVASDGLPNVLLAGNSLILEDVAMPTLENLVSNIVHPSRYVVENTQFLDWYFGLRRLFDEGSYPGRILLGLSANQLASRAVLGEYFGHYMMSGRNVVDVASAAGLDSTEASNLLFANWSAWLGSKTEVRKWVAGHAIPDTTQLAGLLARRSPQSAPLPESSNLIELRLAELKALGYRNHAEIAILLMPDPEATDAAAEIVRNAGSRAGVAILAPVAMRELPLSLYRDGFHLNEQGADRFTNRLAIALRQWITSAIRVRTK